MSMYDEYMKLLDKFKEYLNKDEVICDDKVISVYDLYRIVLDKLEGLSNVNQELDKMKEDINKRYTSRIAKVRNRINPNYLYSEYGCQSLSWHLEDNRVILTFRFQKELGGFVIRVCKNFEENDIYFDTKMKLVGEEYKNIIKGYYDTLLMVMSELEQYKDIGLPRKSADVKLEIVSNELFNLFLLYDATGNVDVEFANYNEMLNLEYLGKESFSSIMQENNWEFLKRIPVEISSLDSSLKNIVLEYFHQSKLGKCLRKKNN